MGIADELKRMTGSLFGGVREDLTTEIPSTDAPGTELPSTDAPTTDIPDEFNTDAPSTDAPTTEVPDDIATLRAELELLKAEKAKGPEPTKAPSTDAPIDEEDFLGELDLDDLTRDPKSFNELLNKVFKRGVETARKELKSGSVGVLSAVPDMVKDNVKTIQTLEHVSNEFYEANKDLKEFKQVVATVFGEVAAASPDKSYADVLASTGDEVRKRLKLTKPTEKVKPPKLPTRGKQQRSTPTEKSKDIESEIDAMNKILNP